MKWITRSHVHVDRVACPWLIARFVDSDAEFLFVPKSEIERVAGETGAIPFDVPDVELGHVDGRCSFESILRRYELKDAALARLAKIVHAADVAAHIDRDPIARGLEAIATGFSVRCPSDHENLAAQFEVYDALYAWCRLQAAANKESAPPLEAAPADPATAGVLGAAAIVERVAGRVALRSHPVPPGAPEASAPQAYRVGSHLDRA